MQAGGSSQKAWAVQGASACVQYDANNNNNMALACAPSPSFLEADFTPMPCDGPSFALIVPRGSREGCKLVLGHLFLSIQLPFQNDSEGEYSPCCMESCKATCGLAGARHHPTSGGVCFVLRFARGIPHSGDHHQITQSVIWR